MAKFFWDLKHGRSHAKKTCLPERLCLIEDTLEMQNMLVNMKRAGSTYNFLLFVEHDKTYVITPSDHENLIKPDNNTKLFRPNMGQLPAHVYTLPENRGGSITYHGPGQLVCYMILDLDELGVSPLELNKIIDETLIEALGHFGVNAREKPPELPGIAAGVWVSAENGTQKKIVSRGVRVAKGASYSKRITKYGFALNVSTDLSYFDYIYPCGLDIQMTSILALTGEMHPLHKVARLVAEILIRRLNKTEKASC